MRIRVQGLFPVAAGRGVVVVIASLVFALSAAPVFAAASGPALRTEVFAIPTSFSVADNAECLNALHTGLVEHLCDEYQVTVTNMGSRPTDGGTVAIADALPAGVTVQKVRFLWSGLPKEDGGEHEDLAELGLCPSTSNPVRCELPTGEDGLPPVAPDETLRMYVYVTVEPGAAESLTNTASVSGGGAADASTEVQNSNGTPPPSFGVDAFGSFVTGLDGASDTQASAHPYEFTQRIELNNELRISPEQGNGGSNPNEFTSIHDVRDVAVDLPVGLAGSALATPTCTLAQLSGPGSCPLDTMVGHIETGETGSGVDGPLFNVVPEHGVAAEFGFVDFLKVSHVIYTSVVPSPGGYVLRATSPEIPQVTLRDITVTLYGDPAAKQEELALREGKTASGITPVAEVTNPSGCSGESLTTAVHMDSWQEPGRFNADGTPDFTDPHWAGATSQSPAVTGCDLLQFQGSLSAQLEATQASAPSGLNVELKISQNENPNTLATPPLRKAVVTFPAGLVVNPSGADGLASCSLAQVGMSASGEPNFSQPSCPETSKIASIELETPALAGVLQGSVYLAAQNENPFHTLLAGYIVVDDPTTGVLVKIPGRIDLDPVTGQLVATFDEAPQFPVSDLKLHFFGGPRAPLTTPQGCGTYTTNSVLTPWSAPDSGPPAMSADSFQVNSGCGGGFNPAFNAGTTNNQAGGFSPFTATFSRQDQDQNLSGVSVTTPPGLLGILKGVERCPEPQACAGHVWRGQSDRAHDGRGGLGPGPILGAGWPGVPHGPV